MPVRDGSIYVGGAIKSILNQTFRDFEFMVTDDYSQDDAFATLASYARADDRISLLHNEGSPVFPERSTPL
jgi:glycosyltransferase involved in cell wall biosynthesis